MHAGTFLGGAWGRVRVFDFGVFGFPGFPGFSGNPGFWMSCCVSMCCVIMCQLAVKVCKTLHINKWVGLFTSLSNDLIAT